MAGNGDEWVKGSGRVPARRVLRLDSLQPGKATKRASGASVFGHLAPVCVTFELKTV